MRKNIKINICKIYFCKNSTSLSFLKVIILNIKFYYFLLTKLINIFFNNFYCYIFSTQCIRFYKTRSLKRVSI